MFYLTRAKKISITVAVLALLISSSARAVTKSFDKGGFHITVEPILAYEFAQVNTPTFHTRGMLQYGARVTAGHKLISGEGEYTLGTTDETFPTQNVNTKTSKQNVRLGVRSELAAMSWLDFVLRFGGQATKTKVDTTTITTATTLTSAPDWEIHPYAGTGLQFHLFNEISAGLEVTYLFKSVSDWSQNEVQTSASLKINLPH